MGCFAPTSVDPREARARVRILRAVASADGEIVSAERLALHVLAGEEAAEAQSSVDLDAEVERIRSEEARRATFEAAFAMASVDGECNADERRVLDRIQTAFDAAGERDLLRVEDEWRDRLRSSIAELADADKNFLRRIGAYNGELSPELYLALVDGLRARRALILREILAPLIVAS
jgi:tellurite resistance protein